LRAVFVVASGELSSRRSTRARSLATDTAGDLFVDQTVNHELLRIVAGFPLTVTEFSTVTTLAAFRS
jgi:hypothetical protein